MNQLDIVTFAVAALAGTLFVRLLFDVFAFRHNHREGIANETARALQESLDILIGDEETEGSEFQNFEAVVSAVGRNVHTVIVWRGVDGHTDRQMFRQDRVKTLRKFDGPGVGAFAGALLSKTKLTMQRHNVIVEKDTFE